MATQTYVTDLQVMNPTAVQNGTVVKTSTPTSAGQKTTIIQPAQAHSGQQFIVTTSAVDHQQLSDQGQQETITIQQATGQAVYPTHLQYVEGSDPGIYANGQMYGPH